MDTPAQGTLTPGKSENIKSGKTAGSEADSVVKTDDVKIEAKSKDADLSKALSSAAGSSTDQSGGADASELDSLQKSLKNYFRGSGSAPLLGFCRKRSREQLTEARGVKILDYKVFSSFETYVFDCDGVIWGIPERDTETSVATINHLLDLGKRVMFVTNNSNKHRRDFVLELEAKGIKFGARDEEEKLRMVISASYTTARYLKENELCRPFVITSHTGILEELRLAGITDYFATVTDDGKVAPEFESPLLVGAKPEIDEIIASKGPVDCIVVGWDMGLTGKKVGTAINYIRWHEDLHGKQEGYRQLPIIASSGDAGGVLGTVEYEKKRVKLRAIGNGAMADIIARSFDPPLEWLDMGKPSDALIDLIRSPAGYGISPQSALMVGDTLQTDIVFGNRAGMQTLLVLSGVTTLGELQDSFKVFQTSYRRPTYVLPKLGSLLNEFKQTPKAEKKASQEL